MRKLHKKPLIMAAAALALTGTLAVGSAMAYFTTYTTAGGGVTMNMGFTETIPNETVDKDGKHVTITNTGDYDCFVRVTAFAPMELPILLRMADGKPKMMVIGTMKAFFRQAKPHRNSISLTNSRKRRINRKNSISWLSRNAHRFFTMKMETHMQTGIM